MDEQQQRAFENHKKTLSAPYLRDDGTTPGPADALPSAAQLERWSEVGIVMLGVTLLAWWGLWTLSRMARPSSPMKYVMSDPWVQAHLKDTRPPTDSPQ
jgi:hypothetical protein